MIIGWKAWFVEVPAQRELLRFSSDITNFKALPSDGCLALLLYDEDLKPDGSHKSIIYKTFDYYFKAGDIYGADVDVRERNVPEEIRARYVDPCIIRGIWTTDDFMDQVEEELRAEM